MRKNFQKRTSRPLEAVQWNKVVLEEADSPSMAREGNKLPYYIFHFFKHVSNIPHLSYAMYSV
jgi:hypothetical protein